MSPPAGEDATDRPGLDGALPPVQHGHHHDQHPTSKSNRILACVLCQQRKIKCDRRFPCANCIKYKATCVPATQARRRRRRFPERELLDRLRRYESLMRQHGVQFEPLHPETTLDDVRSAGKEILEDSGDGESDEDGHKDGSCSSPHKSKDVFEARSLWKAMSQDVEGLYGNLNPALGDVLEDSVKVAWEELAHEDNFVFGSRRNVVALATFHPDPAEILRLWQVYLDNVNPLLKVTHTPSLQSQIIEAASNVSYLPRSLEALMFAIYCASVASLDEDQCESIFKLSKDNLLTKFRFGCQQALMNARFLRNSNRDTLTAFLIYLTAVPSDSDPRSLCSMTAMAIRIAKVMGIHRESSLAKVSHFEAEMRRRLWWSLMIYDTRRAEMSDCHDVELAPTWDCRTPLNIADSDLRPDMKERPKEAKVPTDMLHMALRARIANVVRHSAFYLDFTNPLFKALVPKPGPGSQLSLLLEQVETDHLRHCDPENPLHFFTIYTSRGYIARNMLLEHYAKPIPTDAQRDEAMELAFHMLDCDTKIVLHPSCQGFRWFLQSYFPFPAYIHIIQDIRRRPKGHLVNKAWEVMHENYKQRFPMGSPSINFNPLVKMFCHTILLAWESLKIAYATPSGGPADGPEDGGQDSNSLLQPPPFILGIMERDKALRALSESTDSSMGDINEIMTNDVDDFIARMTGTSVHSGPGPFHTPPMFDNIALSTMRNSFHHPNTSAPLPHPPTMSFPGPSPPPLSPYQFPPSIYGWPSPPQPPPPPQSTGTGATGTPVVVGIGGVDQMLWEQQQQQQQMLDPTKPRPYDQGY